MAIGRFAILAPALGLAASCAPSASAPAADRIEPLAALTGQARAAWGPGDDAVHCTGDRLWCVALAGGGEAAPPTLTLYREGQAGQPAAAPPDPEPSFGAPPAAVWPRIVRQSDGAVLVGMIVERRTWMSGGSASAKRLVFYRGGPDAAGLDVVLDLPWEATAMIRACFSEADMAARREACTDDYEFSSTLALDTEAAAARPRLVVTTRARTYPGRRFRMADSTAEAPLRASDLVWADDPVCSYHRTYAFDAGAGRYLPDRPLPDCGDYF